MDFFERQDAARHRTKWLVLYFGLAVACIILGVYLVMVGVFHRGDFQDGIQGGDLWHAQTFLWVAGGTIAVVLIGSLTKSLALRRGGVAVAEMMGGKRLHPNTRDPAERQLLNIVEEMALASGVAVPPVYLMEHENAINAFAAGHDPHDAVIGVTRGCMKLLNRDELQGVIAHEFSHILNGDMRLNIQLMGIVFGILCIAVIGRVLLHTGYLGGGRSRNNQGGGNALPLIGLALIVIGSAGVFFGRLIQSAVSRQREFLADASAVQFTRNPAGIAGALKKIGGLSTGSKLENPHAAEMSHMFFGEGLKSNWMGAFATHPPLEDRIRAIDPTFTGKFEHVRSLESGGDAGLPSHFASPPPLHRPDEDTVARQKSVSAKEIVRMAGSPQPVHLLAASDWRASLDERLLDAAHDPATVESVIYSLLLSHESAMAEKQLKLLAEQGGQSVAESTAKIAHLTGQLEPAARFPLVEICISALRELTLDGYTQFNRLTRLLIESDRQIDLFEYALEKCIQRHLSPVFEKTRRRSVQHHSINSLMAEFVVVLTLLSRVGGHDEQEARVAFSAAMASLKATGVAVEPAAPEISTLNHTDAALENIATASPPIKKRFLQAASLAVASDGRIQPREAELLRAIADSVDCPIPPFVELFRSVENSD